MVNQWVYAPTKNYRVDMCAKEEYTARVEQFYQIGKTNAKAKYTSAMAQLKQLKEEGKVNSDRYMQRRKEIQAALNTAQEMLDCYVPLHGSYQYRLFGTYRKTGTTTSDAGKAG